MKVQKSHFYAFTGSLPHIFHSWEQPCCDCEFYYLILSLEISLVLKTEISPSGLLFLLLSLSLLPICLYFVLFLLVFWLCSCGCCLFVYLFACLLGCLVGWLVDWLVGCLVLSLSTTLCFLHFAKGGIWWFCTFPTRWQVSRCVKVSQVWANHVSGNLPNFGV